MTEPQHQNRKSPHSSHRSLTDTNYNHPNSDGDDLVLISSLTNSESKETIVCDPNHFKYVEMLMRNLKGNNLKSRGHPVTSPKIDKIFEELDVVKWWWNRRARIQIIDGKMYINNNKMGLDDEEGYRTGVVLFLRRMQQLYGHHLPETDFLWHFHDKKGSMLNLEDYDWWNTSKVPVFVSDFNEASLPDTPTLYMIPRGYLKYKYFADIAEMNGGKRRSKLYNEDNIRRIKDYLEYLEIERNDPELLQWEHKKMNKAVFRGYLDNGFSRHHLFYTLNLSDIEVVARHYFDAKFTTEWANTAEEAHKENFKERDKFHAKKKGEFESLKGNELSVAEQFAFRYQINIDGYGVRDNLYYQLLSGSVILKQLSTLIEFWYFDLMDNEHVIYWENVLDLINAVIKVVDSTDIYRRKKSSSLTGHNAWVRQNWMYMVKHNMSRYSNETLKRITENAKEFVHDHLSADNMDCFFVHMMQIYNHYFYDANSLPTEPHHRLVDLWSRESAQFSPT